MFSRGLKIVLITGAAMTVLALAVHFLLVYDQAPTYAQWDLLNTFVATFATVVFTFFLGALFYDYQAEVAERRRRRQLIYLLVAELKEIARLLDESNATLIDLPDGPPAKAVLIKFQLAAIVETVRSGAFDPALTEAVTNLAARLAAYDASVSLLLSVVSGNAGTDASMAPRAVDELEERRQAVVDRAQALVRDLEGRDVSR